MQKKIEEANLLAKERKEERKRAKVEAKVEAKRVKVEAKMEAKRVKVEAKVEAKRVKVVAKVEAKRAKKRAKDAKATMKAEKQENAALEMQKIPKSRGVGGWHKKRGKWEVVFRLDGGERQGGYFDDPREAVAKYSSYESMANSQ
jgi:hypothetical protein